LNPTHLACSSQRKRHFPAVRRIEPPTTWRDKISSAGKGGPPIRANENRCSNFVWTTILNYYCEKTYIYDVYIHECYSVFSSLDFHSFKIYCIYTILAKYMRRGRVIRHAVYDASKKFFLGFSISSIYWCRQGLFVVM
jgi:hypothetical protein